MILDYYPSFAFKYTLFYTCGNSYDTAYRKGVTTYAFIYEATNRVIALFFCIIFEMIVVKARLKNFHCRWSIKHHHYLFGLNTNM